MTNRYTWRINWSEADQEHVGLCVEFPSLSWLARTPDDALTGIRTLVEECVADMKANAEQIPEPAPTR